MHEKSSSLDLINIQLSLHVVENERLSQQYSNRRSCATGAKGKTIAYQNNIQTTERDLGSTKSAHAKVTAARRTIVENIIRKLVEKQDTVCRQYYALKWGRETTEIWEREAESRSSARREKCIYGECTGVREKELIYTHTHKTSISPTGQTKGPPWQHRLLQTRESRRESR